MDLHRLNAPQRAAVVHGDSPLLVLAGAGTGKTTVITYRIAHFLAERQVAPERILAVTFTNKAAREMRERAGKLCGLDPRALDIGTFHGMCGRILRRYGERIGIAPSFVIYDHDDQLQLVRQCLTSLNLDPQTFTPQAIRHHLEHWKNAGETPEEAKASGLEMLAKKALEVYRLYEETCLAANAVDFGDLLLHTATLLRRVPEVRQALQARWSHILVDEYQDTNHVQYLLLKSLVTDAHSLTVVGDDDQSIYRWRGADIGNILRFERDFPGAELIRLEQNYRSTSVILEAANGVIAHNVARKGKSLSTQGERGEKLHLRLYHSERDEGEGLGDLITAALARGVPPEELAVLYRTNAQSRPIEDALRRRQLPYAIYGGVRFYDRREIRDALAYLRLMVNPRSDVDFLRVVNAPARGIGKTTLERLLEAARARGISLYQAAILVAAGELQLAGRPNKGLSEFVALVEQLRGLEGKEPLGRLLERVLDDSGYLAALKQDESEDAADRIENLAELVAALDEYVELNVDATLAGFVEEASLATDVDGLKEGGGQVSLMTLHTAKGLEFTEVFLPGLEEGLFPHSRSVGERAALEEERRLCYVGLTRARRQVHLSAARVRANFGELRRSELSRFVAEVPTELLVLGAGAAGLEESLTAAPYARRSAPAPERHVEYFDAPEAVPAPALRGEASAGDLARGAHVFHASFGEGQVIDSEGTGPRQKLTIEFPSVGRKTIIARFVDRR